MFFELQAGKGKWRYRAQDTYGEKALARFSVERALYRFLNGTEDEDSSLEVDFGAQSGELCVWRVSLRPSSEVDFRAQSGELCVWGVSLEPSLEVNFRAQSGELCVWRVCVDPS